MIRSRSYIAVPPGATIKEQLIDRNMSQKEFAARMDMSEKHISRLINGEVQLTPDVSVRLEIVLGVPARFWNNLEAIYREKLIKAEAENTMEIDLEIARRLPYREMADYGWVPKTDDKKEKVINLRKYFEVIQLSLLENTQITRIACRRLAITEKSDLALLAWVQAARIKARNIKTKPMNMKKFNEAVSVIRGMTVLKPDEFCPEMMRILADCGVSVVFLPHLKGSFLHGASFLDGTRIVIGLTDRGKDADRFWFSLFHEFAHIALGHLEQTEAVSEYDEKAADRWAEDRLINAENFDRFRTERDFSEKNVISFAGKEGIAPGIVVGRLQSEGLIKHNMLNYLKKAYEIDECGV